MTGTETETNGGRETKRQRGKQTDTQTLPHNHKHTCWHTATLVDGQLVSHFTGLHGLYQYRYVLGLASGPGCTLNWTAVTNKQAADETSSSVGDRTGTQRRAQTLTGQSNMEERSTHVPLPRARHVLLGDSVSCRHTERDNERNNDTVSDVTFFHTHTHTPPTHCWHMDETVCTRD